MQIWLQLGKYLQWINYLKFKWEIALACTLSKKNIILFEFIYINLRINVLLIQ